MNLSSKLNCRVALFGKSKTENELGESTFTYSKIKNVWAEITPSGGSVKEGEGNTTYADISHKIIVRENSIPNLTNDMYFVFKEQRYDIKYFNPNYKYRDRVEIMCSLVVE